MQSIVVGLTNAGKTCFVLNFAEFLGLKRLTLNMIESRGFIVGKEVDISAAKKDFISSEPHTTRNLQSMKIKVARGKGVRELELFDSCGLTPGIHSQLEIRRAMAQTLSKLRKASLILHIIDLYTLPVSRITPAIKLEEQIYKFGISRNNYGLLANKIDLPHTLEKIPVLRRHFPEAPIFPVSAKEKKGFKEVKSFVWRNL